MKLEFSRQIFAKCSNIKFRENPFSECRVVLWGRTDRQTDMTKLIVTFRNFTNAPNKFMLLFILYIFRALYIYLLYIIPTYCSYWHTIYVVVICNIHSPTCFSLDKPSSAGFNYKPKHVEECILQNSTTYILFIITFSHSLLSIQKSVISYRKNLWTTVYT